MRAVYGLFSDSDAAERAVGALQAAGIAERDIVVMSAEPLEAPAFSQRERSTWLFWIAVGGGCLGALFAALLTTATARSWPLVTGRMPIVTWWPYLIIIFELSMLGAIVATAIALIVTAKLLRRQPVLSDPEVSDGKILVGVQNPPDGTVSVLERALGPGCRMV